MHLPVRARRRILPVVAVVVCAAAIGVAFAQDEAIFRTDTRLVVLHATVVDKSGKVVNNLPKNSFKVYENGKEQSIKLFKREDVPVSMGILIDDSGSMRDK